MRSTRTRTSLGRWHAVRDERASVIVEATFIYPVVFSVLVMLLYVGDMYYQRSWVESAVMNYSIQGADQIANGSLTGISVDESTGIAHLDLTKVKNDPYRFIFNLGTDTGGVEEIIESAEASLATMINAGEASFFGLTPDINSVDIRYESHVIYGDYWVDVDYGFNVPVAGFIESDMTYDVKLAASSVSTVTSMGELVRNIDLADDLYGMTGLTNEVKTAGDFGTAVRKAIEQIQETFG